MEPRDDDIEFDFFDDEPATGETQTTSRVRMPRAPRRSTPGPAGPPHGSAPMLRLLGLVVLVVVLVLAFVLVIQSCTGSSKDTYAEYMSKVTPIARQSAQNGKRVETTLTTPGLKVAEIQRQLRSIAAAETQNVEAALALDAPGKLREEHAHLVEALQFRVSGTSGLAATFRATAASTDDARDAALLALQADRLVASDVVWDDLFKAPAESVLDDEGVTGVLVPDSNYLSSDLALETAASFELVLQRIRGTSTDEPGATPGLHGTNIVSVKALPADQTLSADSLNTITTTLELAFAVTVKDSGDFQETQIPVTLTIENGANPIVKTEQIQIINPDEETVVTFDEIVDVPFGSQTTLKIDVKPVELEEKTDNNSAEYAVIFSLPG